GSGTLTADRAVRVGDDLYRGTDIVLATGSFSRSLPGIDLGEHIITSDAALALERVPERAIILGGGVIGVEFASAWRSLGAEVTIIEGLDRLVPNEDATLSTALERAFRRRGIVTKVGARVASAVESGDGVRVTLEGGGEL